MLYFIRCQTTSGVPNIVGWPKARSKLSVKSVGLPIAQGKLVYEFNFHKECVNLPCRLYKRNKYLLFKKAGENKTSQSQNVLAWQRVRANFTSVNVLMCLSPTSDHIELLWIQALSYDGHDKQVLCPQREAYSNQTTCPKCLSVHIISGVNLLYYFR